MATVNIRRDVEDKFYRYKMPVLLTKIEGRGNGIKTVVPNMEDVARALDRPPTYPTKFFGCELGAQTTVANDRYIVNGAHQSDRLRELLDVFIEKFVLCPSCKNPETELVITGRGQGDDIHRDCKACGRQNGIDMRHKLTTYILKNPPKKKGKKGKKGMTADANVGGSGPGIVVEDNGKGSDGDDDEGTGATSASVDDLDKIIGRQEVVPNITPVTAKIADDDWSVDTSAAAVAARMKSLEVNVDAIVNGGDDDAEDDDADSPYAMLGAWLEENRSASDDDVLAKMKELGIAGKHKALVEIGDKLFTEKVVAEVTAREKLLATLITSEKHQKSFLGGIERLVGQRYPDALLASGAVPKVLMTLYQADLLDEDLVKQWGTHVSKKYVDKETCKKVRKTAEAFLTWLDEAEDDDSDDE